MGRQIDRYVHSYRDIETKESMELPCDSPPYVGKHTDAYIYIYIYIDG